MRTQMFCAFSNGFWFLYLLMVVLLLPGHAGAVEAALKPAPKACLLPAMSVISYTPAILKDKRPGGANKGCACMTDRPISEGRTSDGWNLPPAWASTFAPAGDGDVQNYTRMWGGGTGARGLSTDTGLGLAMRFPIEGPDLVKLIYPGPNPDLVQEPLQLFEVQFYVNY